MLDHLAIAAKYRRWFGRPVFQIGDADDKVESDLDISRCPLERYAFEAVHTFDEVDAADPVKLMPDIPYIHLMLRQCLTEQRVLFPKSRRVVATWTAKTYLSWIGLKYKNRNIAIISKKEDDAKAEIEHIYEAILANLPAWLRDLYVFEYRKGRGELEIISYRGKPWHSKFRSFARGMDQLRRWTVSVYYADEAGFQENYADTVAAGMPTLVSRRGLEGQFIATSSLDSDPNNQFTIQCGGIDNVRRLAGIAKGEMAEVA